MNITEINGAHNIRDFGGYPTKDGRHVKKGLLYRGGELAALNEEELKAFKEVPFQTILDLRNDHEVAIAKDPEISGAQYLRFPIIQESNELIALEKFHLDQSFDESVLLSNKVSYGAELLYRRMPFGAQAYQVMFDELQAHHVPIYIHCKSGKDRTGIGATLILLALGVSEEDAIKEYMLTNEYRKFYIEHFMYRFHALIQEDKDAVKKLMWLPGVNEENIRAALNEIHLRYSSIEEFLLKEYHQSEEKLEKLRDFYLE